MFSRRQAMRWAELWVTCWNDGDLDTVLTLYRDDVRFESPLAEAVTGSALVEGKDALRRYWTAAMADLRSIRLTLERVVWDGGERELAIVYRATLGRSLVRGCELVTFDVAGRVIRGEACFGSEIGSGSAAEAVGTTKETVMMGSRIRRIATAAIGLAVAGALSVGSAVAQTQSAATPLAPELEGLGTLHVPATTTVARAQQFFDQGIRLLYAFNHPEAIRAFREAARLDPAMAMAYWGQALALGPNLNAPMTPENGRQAYAAIRQAVRAAADVTPRERGLIDALAARYARAGGGDRAALDRAYAAAMEKLAARFPDDPDIGTLYADAQMNVMPWDYWQKDGSPKPDTARVIETLESVIARAPDHPGALHYHIHVLEASQHPERAEASADRLGALMPSAGHMVHMPAHIYIRVGRYADAAEANERAIVADEDYLAQCQAQGLYPISYYPHNLHFLWAAATLEGRRDVAVDAARRVAEKVPHHHAGAVAWTADFPVTPLLAYARFGLWHDVLTHPRPPANDPYANGIWHYARGMAFVARRELDRAAAELAALEAVKKHEAFQTTLKDLPLLANLQIASRLAEGELRARRGDVEGAIRILQEGAAIEESLPYAEPPLWHHPVRQVLGAVLLEAGRAAEAEAAYREDLKVFRENGWSLFGLAASLRTQGRTDEALDVQRRFEKAWARADITLTSSRILAPPSPGAKVDRRPNDRHGVHRHHAPVQQTIDLPHRTTLAYSEQGDPDGMPVILLHGYTDSWRSYERVLPHMPRALRVFAVTHRGHGDSGKPDAGYETKDFSDDLAAFMDARGIHRAVVVGHSMGSVVQQRFAIDHPDRVRALVLEGAFLPRSGNPAVGAFYRDVMELTDPIEPAFAREFQESTLARPVPPEFLDTVVGESLKLPARVWKAALAPYVDPSFDFTDAVRSIRVPTLIIWGDRDAFTRRAEQDELAASIAGSRLAIYEGGGHSPHWEEPERFARDLVEFLGPH
jgi:pimeloyl-ACP methyl ester carboxylesterase